MREIAELSNLKELIFIEFPAFQQPIDEFTCFQEDPLGFLLTEVVHEPLVEARILVLHLVPHSIPQHQLLPQDVWKDHVYCVYQSIEIHTVHISRGIYRDIPQQSLLTLFAVFHGTQDLADLAHIEHAMLAIH